MNGSAVKRLALCFDGTWNTPEDQTNVSRIYAAIADQHSGCESQLKFYDAGVGTEAGSRFAGGAFGLGLDENLLEGYCWLVNQYPGATEKLPPDPGDQEVFQDGPDIFIFGFSRGAYTARSLAGLINRCGLLRLDRVRGDPKWRERPTQAALVKQAWELYGTKFEGEARQAENCKAFRSENSLDVKIKFIGVWDTVGALGVPMFSTRWMLSGARRAFHDTSLCRVVENAYHAVAIDEHREDYKVTLWDKKHPGTREVEQRWFPGAHGNVGGGYEDDLLPDPPLRWISKLAVKHGLEFVDEMKMQLAESPTCKLALPVDFELRGDEYLSPVRDSYAHFLRGAYRFLRAIALRGRYYRPMLVDGVNETIDETAQMKWAADASYRPRNFAGAGRSSVAPQLVTPVMPSAAPETSGHA